MPATGWLVREAGLHNYPEIKINMFIPPHCRTQARRKSIHRRYYFQTNASSLQN
jgi:hypothetical protein